MSTESTLRELLDNKYKELKQQGEFIGRLKSSHTKDSPEYQDALKVLKALKLERQELLNQLKELTSVESDTARSYIPDGSFHQQTIMSTESTLRELLDNKYKEVKQQGEFIRHLKSSHTKDSPEYQEALKVLKALKLERQELQNQLKELTSVDSNTGNAFNGMSKEAFRKAVNNVLEKHMFFVKSFKIYGGVAGFYDFGDPGCRIKRNVLNYWHQHFEHEEKMLGVVTPALTSEALLKASGHLEKFTDVMVKDEKTGSCYRADHLLRDYCENKLEKDLTISSEDAAELKHILAVLGGFSAEQLGAKIKEYGIVAPHTKNPLSDPYPFNLMFRITSEMGTEYMRPELAQGMFVRFKQYYKMMGKKIPFAVAQVGCVFRNEIAPKHKLLRLREFTVAEIEHFVDPMDKSHHKFSEVSNLEIFMLPRAEQVASQSAKRLCLHDAVIEGIINNQTIGYFIGRTYLFLTSLGIDKDRLRFRQHLPKEMAHYASDCWDAEIETSYGWIECVGIADRSDYDLRAHSEKSGVALVAREKSALPKEVEKLVIKPNKKVLGPEFKSDHTKVVEALEAMTEAKALEMKAALESEGKFEFEVSNLQKFVTIKKNMVSIEVERTWEYEERIFFPNVIEPSFGIDRILYCLYEHSFYTRFSEKGIRQLNVFRFLPQFAPFKCAVFHSKQLEDVAKRIHKSLVAASLPMKLITAGTSIENDYEYADELGIPFAVNVESETSVTIRERDSRDLIRVSVDEVAAVVKKLSNGTTTWAEISPAHKSNLAREQESKEQIFVDVDEMAAIKKDLSEGRTTLVDVLQKYPLLTKQILPIVLKTLP